MNRSPYYSPLARAADMDVGGAADLQTDIMRFMAILALCLVAIFALVQSIPLEPIEPVSSRVSIEKPSPVETQARIAVASPQPAPQPARQPEPRKPATTSAPETVKAFPSAPARPVTIREPVPTPAPPVTATRESKAIAPKATPAPAPAPTPQPAEPEGFTLRFASDTALTRLVARNEIGLYAITPERALRMSMNRGAPSFWPASAPNRYHEMDPATVPANVITALRRAGTLGLDPAVKWGVTLPSGMRRQLDRYLSEHSGGELVIEPTGTLRLEN